MIEDIYALNGRKDVLNQWKEKGYIIKEKTAVEKAREYNPEYGCGSCGCLKELKSLYEKAIQELQKQIEDDWKRKLMNCCQKKTN